MNETRLDPRLAGAEAMATYLIDVSGEICGYVPTCDVERHKGGDYLLYPAVRRHGALVWRGEIIAARTTDDVGTARAFAVGCAQRYIVLRCLLPQAVTDPMWSHYLDRATGEPVVMPDTRQVGMFDGNTEGPPELPLPATQEDRTGLNEEEPFDPTTKEGWQTLDGFPCPQLIPTPPMPIEGETPEQYDLRKLEAQREHDELWNKTDENEAAS